MNAKLKKNSVVTHRIEESGMITFIVKDAGEFVFDPLKVSETLMRRAALHGFIQRISDGAAIARDENGVAASANDKRDRMQRIAAHLESGTDQWQLVVAAGGQTEGGLTILAIVRSGLAENADAANDLVTRLMAKRTIERKAALAVWASTKKVAEALVEIRAERAKKAAEASEVDAEALLAEMDEEEDQE